MSRKPVKLEMLDDNPGHYSAVLLDSIVNRKNNNSTNKNNNNQMTANPLFNASFLNPMNAKNNNSLNTNHSLTNNSMKHHNNLSNSTNGTLTSSSGTTVTSSGNPTPTSNLPSVVASNGIMSPSTLSNSLKIENLEPSITKHIPVTSATLISNNIVSSTDDSNTNNLAKGTTCSTTASLLNSATIASIYNDLPNPATLLNNPLNDVQISDLMNNNNSINGNSLATGENGQLTNRTLKKYKAIAIEFDEFLEKPSNLHSNGEKWYVVFMNCLQQIKESKLTLNTDEHNKAQNVLRAVITAYMSTLKTPDGRHYGVSSYLVRRSAIRWHIDRKYNYEMGMTKGWTNLFKRSNYVDQEENMVNPVVAGGPVAHNGSLTNTKWDTDKTKANEILTDTTNLYNFQSSLNFDDITSGNSNNNLHSSLPNSTVRKVSSSPSMLASDLTDLGSALSSIVSVPVVPSSSQIINNASSVPKLISPKNFVNSGLQPVNPKPISVTNAISPNYPNGNLNNYSTALPVTTASNTETSLVSSSVDNLTNSLNTVDQNSIKSHVTEILQKLNDEAEQNKTRCIPEKDLHMMYLSWYQDSNLNKLVNVYNNPILMVSYIYWRGL